LPATLADADGFELVGLTCTAPTEFDELLLPEPATDVGADAAAPVAGRPALADGLTAVLPA